MPPQRSVAIPGSSAHGGLHPPNIAVQIATMVQRVAMRGSITCRLICLFAALSLPLACTGTAGPLGGTPDGRPPVLSPPPDLPGAVLAPVKSNPTAPVSEDGTAWGGPSAPELSGVQFVPNRDSAVLVLPVVQGAVDYRVFRLPAGATASSVAGGERIDGTVMHCAGYRQHNDAYTGTRELLQIIEATDLQGPTDLVVEAIDAPCPFSGHLAPVHQNLQVTIDEVPVEDRIAFSLFTADEIRARMGSLILNGHGKGPSLAAPSGAVTPKVLARTFVTVKPSGKRTPRTADFFDDFDGTHGALASTGVADGAGRTYSPGRRFENQQWELFIYNDADKTAQVSEERGLLHVTLPDWKQDVFSTVVAIPRRPAELSATDYLHLTWEVASNATSRRYWWVGLCGAESAGATFSPDGHFQGNLVQTSFFYQDDGRNVSVEGWNCLQFFPRDGSPFGLGTHSRTEADLRVMVNTANAADRSNVVNLSPAQYPASSAKPSWFVMQKAAGQVGSQILRDELLISPRTRFDAYVRRDRLVLFVNGEQRLCNDFPTHALTMNQAAIAFGQVLYHSAAERLEFSRSYNDRTGQRYYLENAPYADERDWDNVGFESHVGPPSTLDASTCFIAP